MARAIVTGARASQPLLGSWDLARAEPGRATAPDDLDSIDLEWIAIKEPVPVAAALRAAGRWDGTQPIDLDAYDWWYRCQFPAPLTREPLRLRFDGLATVADAWLNGEPILHSSSMFVGHTVDITPTVQSNNTLWIRCHALAPLLAAYPSRPRPRWKVALVEHQALRWVRTSLLGRMRPWCPRIAPVGPWRTIALETSPVHIEHSEIETRLDGHDGLVRVRVRARMYRGSAQLAPSLSEGSLQVAGRDIPFQSKPLTGDVYELTCSARLASPERWWPHTHGTPRTYELRVRLTGDVDETLDLGRVGFRTIDLDRGQDGRGFGLVVNGTPVFCRGVCWTPPDPARLSADPVAYRAALGQLRDAGINMVRLAGTTTYESDAFHDLCDELGILVWQDFMFANMDYPWQDATFTSMAQLEAAQVLERLQGRPSLAVLCGSSEVEQQAAMLGLPLQTATDSSAAPLAELVRNTVPDVVWLATTPTGGTMPFHADCGVSHYFGVGAYRRPFEDARRAQVRFAAECLAFSNVPEPLTLARTVTLGREWKDSVPRDAGADWDFEDVRDHYVEQLFDARTDDLRAIDPDRYLALGRVATGEAILRTFAEWRRPGSTCRGGLVWFARDLANGPGWGIIDASGRPKSVYWYLKHACAPVALLCADEGLNGLWVHAMNDSPDPIAGELRVALYGTGRMRGRPVSVSLDLDPHSSQSVHVDGLFDGFLDLTYAYRFGPPQHDVVSFALTDRTTGALRATACYFPVRLPHTPDPDLQLTCDVDVAGNDYALVLAANRFAHAVAIEIDGFVPDDNYLSLEPGQPRRVSLRRAEDTSPSRVPEGRVTALTGCAPVRIVVSEVVDAG